MVRSAVAAWPDGEGLRLIFEPGRLIAGNAGILLARVVVRKSGDVKEFVVLDAAMNDLLRPTLYGAYHDIRAVRPRAGTMTATVVGPVCETGDTFATDRAVPPLDEGDLVALMSAGTMILPRLVSLDLLHPGAGAVLFGFVSGAALLALFLLLILSASMSTLASLVLVSASAIVIDVLKVHRSDKMSAGNQVHVMRFLTLLFIILSFLLVTQAVSLEFSA